MAWWASPQWLFWSTDAGHCRTVSTVNRNQWPLLTSISYIFLVGKQEIRKHFLAWILMLTRRILFSFYWITKSYLPFNISFCYAWSSLFWTQYKLKRKDRAKGQDNAMRTYEYFPCCKLKSFPNECVQSAGYFVTFLEALSARFINNWSLNKGLFPSSMQKYISLICGLRTN